MTIYLVWGEGYSAAFSTLEMAEAYRESLRVVDPGEYHIWTYVLDAQK